MKKIKIQIPEGYEIDTDNSSLIDGDIAFKRKENTLPTTNEEAVEFLPEICCYIGTYGKIEETDCDKECLNTIATKELAEAFLALIQLVKFRDIWNDGWKADCTDDAIKYVIYFTSSVKHDYLVRIPSILSFKSEELRDKFSETFDKLIQTAKPLL